MTPEEIERALADLANPRKAIQRPAAERLAEAARTEPSLRARIAASLSSDDPRRRWGAAYALTLLDHAPLDAMPVLLDALGSSDGDVRWAAARLVTRAAREVPRLTDDLRRLVTAASPLQRKMALYCLRDMADASVLSRGIVAPALTDVEPAVRLAAMATMAALGPRTTETADLIAALLDDGDPGVRRAAAATLGQLGVRTPAIEERLGRASVSGDPALERAARQALSRLAAVAASDR